MQLVSGTHSRAGLALTPFESMRPSSQAFDASARVLKKRAAQSHLSMRIAVTRKRGRRLRWVSVEIFRHQGFASVFQMYKNSASFEVTLESGAVQR